MERQIKVTKGEKWISVSVQYANGYSAQWDYAKTDEQVEKYLNDGNLDSNARWHEHQNCFLAPCADCIAKVEAAITSPAFGYARMSTELGVPYTKIYMRDDNSPTGVIGAGGCPQTVWETLAKKHNCAGQYLAPGEKW